MVTFNGIVALQKGVYEATWTGFVSAGNGTAADMANLPDKTVHVVGAFASGNNEIKIEGSNDTTATGTYDTLNDPSQNALSFSTGKIEVILENTRWVRPVAVSLVGATGAPGMTVKIIARASLR